MSISEALDAVHTLHRRYGTGIHCSQPTCSVCACFALAKEVERLRVKAKLCTHCDEPMVDGICARCSL